MRKFLKAPDLTDRVSDKLNKFTQALRGDPGADDYKTNLGLIAANNGVVLFASADELLAMLPIEDALDAALHIRAKFVEIFADIAAVCVQGVKIRPSLSGAIVFAHRQTPLRWVMQESVRCLDRVAKDATGRDALAISLIDLGGRHGEWAAPWEFSAGALPLYTPVEALRDLVAMAVTQNDLAFVGSNQFFHDLMDHLKPFAFEHEASDIASRIKQNRATEDKAEIQRLIDYLLRVNATQTAKSHPEFAKASGHYREIIATYWVKENESKRTRALYPASWVGPHLVRFLAQNWRKQSISAAVVPDVTKAAA